MSVAKKLMAARMLLQKRELKKTGLNKFAGYQYFELADFLPAAQEIFDSLGLCGLVSYSADIATMRVIDVEDGTELVITSPMGSAVMKGMHEVQSIGAVETYQRRYLWVTALEIVEHDAIDGAAGERTPDVAAILKGITGSATLEVLKANYEAAIQMLPKDHHKAINKATNTRKSELTEKEAA